VHWFYYYLISYQSVTVLLGARNVKSYNEPNRIVLKSSQYFIHPQYQKAIIKNDLALIRLPVPVTFNSKCCIAFLNRSVVLNEMLMKIYLDYIQPARLPDSTDPLRVGDAVTVTGWGKTTESIFYNLFKI
jgi:hypothetical protein